MYQYALQNYGYLFYIIDQNSKLVTLLSNGNMLYLQEATEGNMLYLHEIND